MSNKAKGNAYENHCARLFSELGFWVHLCAPNASGSQPADIIACKDNISILVDAKKCEHDNFPFSRIELNQALAMEKFTKCGNKASYFMFGTSTGDYLIEFDYIKRCIERGQKQFTSSDFARFKTFQEVASENNF